MSDVLMGSRVGGSKIVSSRGDICGSNGLSSDHDGRSVGTVVLGVGF